MISNHIDIYEDGILIDGHEVLVKEDGPYITEGKDGDILTVALDLLPETVTHHRTKKPEQQAKAKTAGTAYVDIQVKPVFDTTEAIEALEALNK